MKLLLTSKISKSMRHGLAVSLLAGVGVSPVLAQSADAPVAVEDMLIRAQLLEDVGAAERINYAGKLRMLSQRIPATACNMKSGIAVDTSGPMYDAARAEFETILAALEFGDDSLNINGEETRRKTLVAVEALKGSWADINAASLTADDLQTKADTNMGVLENAKMLVSEISGQYSDPTALLQADALRIDIAGRQRMLTQKISKEVCFIMSDINADASMEVLGATVNMFEVSLNALQNGMPEAGIGPAPTDEIAAQLTQVVADWNTVKAHIDTVMSGGTLDDETRTAVFVGLNKTMADMNVAVGMFAESSKLSL